MYETLCTYPLPSDLFAQTIHPSVPLIGIGLASGHVQALRLPSLGSSSESSVSDDDTAPPPPPDGRGTIVTSWQTRRHKGSCRALAFSTDGEQLISAGREGLVKVASSETGKVQWKIAVPEENSAPTAPSLLHVLSPTTLLLATDTSALHIYDLRAPTSASASTRPSATHRPHDDYVSSLTPLPPTDTSTSGFSKQWISTGGGTLAVTDLRRGVMARSEDQEDELLSSVYITGLGRRGTSTGEKVLVGGNTGVLTLWEKGQWDDQDERIVVDKGDRRSKVDVQSLDVLAEVPGGIGGSKAVAVGLDGGTVRFVALGKNKVVGEVRHDDLEGVVGLGFECEGRMVSGGGSVVKVWQEGVGVVNGDLQVAMRKREMESEDELASDSDSEDSDEGEKGRKRRKKRKRSKGRDKSGGKAGIPAFKGLD